MLTDRIRINVKAGRGGDGKVAFGRDRKPSGGDGGKGGSIIVEGSSNIYDLSKLRHQREYKATPGEMGGSERATGKDGKDLIISVPITTVVIDDEKNEVVKITEPGQRHIIANGGRGGLGNFNFRYGQRLTLNKTTPGEAGEEFNFNLELRLISDIIFIGFPNAGKSSMLNMLTNADVKIAPYPFTTLEPHQGIAEGMLLMDLPGLIEGSSEGKGVGTKFKKHTEYAKLIAHFISLESQDMIGDYEKIRAELKGMGESLYNLPECLVLTKSDMFNEEYIKEKIAEIKKLKLPYIVTSCFDFSKLGDITTFFKDQLKSTSNS